MGTYKSPKPALLIANAKSKALWVQNFSHREATICAGSKWTRESIISMTKDVPKSPEE